MPNNPERPFGRHTLKLDATFVPDGAEDELCRADIVAAVGSRPLKIPAVLVPEGDPPPGHPYVSVGEFEFRPDEDDAMNPGMASARPPKVQGSGHSG